MHRHTRAQLRAEQLLVQHAKSSDSGTVCTMVSVRFDCKSGLGHGEIRYYSCFDTDESKGSPCVHRFLTAATTIWKFRTVVHFVFWSWRSVTWNSHWCGIFCLTVRINSSIHLIPLFDCNFMLAGQNYGADHELDLLDFYDGAIFDVMCTSA